MKDGKAICILASNRANSDEAEASRRICQVISGALAEEEIACQMLELKKFEPAPCTGCGRCYDIRRCGRDKDFNRIYEELSGADYLFFISPCYAPVPAKLCMLLEKMKQIAFLHHWRETEGQTDIQGKLAGIISLGGRTESPGSCKAMVNDTIANALGAASMKVVPYNLKWDTGICLPVRKNRSDAGTFPVFQYGWEETVRKYVEIIIQTEKSLYAIL